jgi:hypothetical protein
MRLLQQLSAGDISSNDGCCHPNTV